MRTRMFPRRLLHAVMVALLSVVPFRVPLATTHGTFHYDTSNVDTAAHWAARSTLANAVMFSGLGEPLRLSMSAMDGILKHAGYVTRPPMPTMALVGTVYAGGSPRYPRTPDFAKPATLAWDAASFDRTLDAAAQAWTLVKITSPNFHLLFHDRKADRRAALVMLPQAKAQADTLWNRLRNQDGLFAARSPDGTYAVPEPVDQAAVLWGASNLILAATSTADDYWHRAYRDLIDPDDYRALADSALAALRNLPPHDAQARAIAIEALGRSALAANTPDTRRQALALARDHANALRASPPEALEAVALAIYGLVEAGRLTGEPAYGDAARRLFRDRLVPLWSEQRGVFLTRVGTATYTPARTAAVVAALNAIRWYGAEGAARQAAAIYPRFFETVLVRGRLLQSSPAPLVPALYQEQAPAAHFAHPALPAPAAAGVAPVFAAEITLDHGSWAVTDPRFRTGPALFLSTMLVKQRAGEADAFLPAQRLHDLR
jgi:hypothetical protein